MGQQRATQQNGGFIVAQTRANGTNSKESNAIRRTLAKDGAKRALGRINF